VSSVSEGQWDKLAAGRREALHLDVGPHSLRGNTNVWFPYMNCSLIGIQKAACTCEYARRFKQRRNGAAEDTQMKSQMMREAGEQT